MRNFFIVLVILFLTVSIPVLAQSNWTTIHTITGSSSLNTDDFEIKQKKWKIVWEANKQYEEDYGGNFIVIMVDTNDEEYLVVNALIPQKGETIIRKSGKFYFQITSLITDWVIKIQVPSAGGD